MKENQTHLTMNLQNKDLNIIQWNCAGFSSHFNEFKLLTSNISPLAVCLQETKFKSDFIPHFKNYDVYFKNNVSTTIAHGGVAIFVNNNFESEPFNINSNLQVIAVKISFPFKFVICNIYLPPNDHISYTEINNIVAQINMPFIFVGDFNAHSHLWSSVKTDARGNVIESVILNNDLVLMNKNDAPTHFSFAYKTFSTIDLTITSPEICDKFSWYVCNDLHNSDHFPIITKILNSDVTSNRRQTWKMNSADWKKFDVNFEKNINSFSDVNEIEQYIRSRITESASKCIPKTTTNCPKKIVPWWSQEINELIKKRKYLLNKFKRNQDINIYKEFLKVKYTTRRIIREAQKKSWEEYIEIINSKTSSKEIFDKIKKINGKAFQNITHLNVNNVNITDKNDISNILGNSFSKISSSENYNEIFKQNQKYINLCDQMKYKENKHETYNTEITLNELEFALNRCKGSSPGPDNIRYEMIKHLKKEEKLYILKFYNIIWSKQEFPSAWREALVIPILKPGKDPSKKDSYRPISLTNCLCKLLERIINNRLNWYLKDKQIIDPRQAAFQRNKCTLDNLATIESDIMESFNKNENVIGVFFDIKKAYDSIYKPIIISRLISIGIRGNMLIFIANFLKDRTFQCMIGSTLSNIYKQENGVPQGAVLSVSLFLIVINDILNQIKKPSKALLYADDLIVYCKGKNMIRLTANIQKTINNLSKWSNNVGLQFNENKTVAIRFSRKYNQITNLPLYLNNQTIEFVNHTKYLGIIFDNKLNFREHIKEIKAKCNRKLNILKILSNSRYGSDQKLLLRIHNIIILSVIDYSSFIIDSICETDLKKLDTVHNAGLRIALGAFKSSPIKSLEIESGMYSLKYRRLKQLLTYSLKSLALDNEFSKNLNNLQKIEKFKTKQRKYQPCYVRAKI